MTAMDGDVMRAGRKAAGHPWFHRVSRVGLVARGLIYLLIGWLALRIGFGGSGQEAERKGALQVVADGPGGTVVLWLVAAGFAAPPAWQLAEVLSGGPCRTGTGSTSGSGRPPAASSTRPAPRGPWASSSATRARRPTSSRRRTPRGRWPSPEAAGSSWPSPRASWCGAGR